MPVIAIQALELDAKQKKQIAREYTRILSHVTNVPKDNIYIFFGGFPLNGIAAGGVLNSALPDSVLSRFNIKYTKHHEKPGTVCVMTRMKAKPGMEEEAERISLDFVRETRLEPGCISYDLFRSKKDIYKQERTSSWFILQERFRDMAAVGAHMETAHFKGYMAQKDKLFDGGFEVCGKISGPSRNTAEVAEGKIKLVVWMHAQEKKSDAILKGNLEMRKRLKKLDGSLAYDLYQGFPGIGDKSVFLADQTWKDRKSLDNAIENILADMPFFMEDLRTTRQALVFEMASELPYDLPEEEPFLFENAVAGDPDLKEGLAKMNPAFAKLCLDASEKAYETPLLDQRTKILFALVVDVVEQIHGKPFENHLMMAKKNGISKEELFELLLFLTVYVGFNKAGAYYQPINAFYG
jgi:4-carboxymuconolactone decarboxylase